QPLQNTILKKRNANLRSVSRFSSFGSFRLTCRGGRILAAPPAAASRRPDCLPVRVNDAAVAAKRSISGGSIQATGSSGAVRAPNLGASLASVQIGAALASRVEAIGPNVPVEAAEYFSENATVAETEALRHEVVNHRVGCGVGKANQVQHHHGLLPDRAAPAAAMPPGADSPHAALILPRHRPLQNPHNGGRGEHHHAEWQQEQQAEGGHDVSVPAARAEAVHAVLAAHVAVAANAVEGLGGRVHRLHQAEGGWDAPGGGHEVSRCQVQHVAVGDGSHCSVQTDGADNQQVAEEHHQPDADPDSREPGADSGQLQEVPILGGVHLVAAWYMYVYRPVETHNSFGHRLVRVFAYNLNCRSGKNFYWRPQPDAKVWCLGGRTCLLNLASHQQRQSNNMHRLTVALLLLSLTAVFVCSAYEDSDYADDYAEEPALESDEADDDEDLQKRCRWVYRRKHKRHTLACP
uniref:Secreted protein n=3 Tax=Macrostomum lignano TaxID=282301 RepID=A0A1I8FY53_9PLAT